MSEIIFLETYLPRQLSDQEIEKIVAVAIEEASATSPSDIGKVMKIVLPRITGQAPSDRVSKIVRDLLGKN
jgi:uncharacterized protein YqeY